MNDEHDIDETPRGGSGFDVTSDGGAPRPGGGKRANATSDFKLDLQATSDGGIDPDGETRSPSGELSYESDGIKSPTKIPTKRIGNYEVLQLLGQGGMGSVFLARHLKLDKEVALKLIRPRGKRNEYVEARFDRELRAVGKLDHPNIVRAFDAGEFNGITFLSMELLQGADLDQAAAQGATLELADACEVIRQAALGLKYVHDQGLVHRDIKPSNLMLASDPVSDVRVKVMDLGLALIKGDADDERLTDDGVAIGTFRYMPLEQARNTRGVDYRADIYSLGATFYRLLVGKSPYPSDVFETPHQMLMALMNADVPQVSEHVPDLPSGISELITRMLARDPDDRPQDLGEVAETLAPFSKSHRLGALLERASESVREARVAGNQDPFSGLIDQLVHATQLGPEPSMAGLEVSSDDLSILRQRVRRFWVDGVLSRTKDNTHLFSLNREFVSECVTGPWEGIAESPLHDSAPDAPIDQLYESSERSILILGDAGSGKSTTLLELTEYLLRKSESNPNEPVPVLLHLSSWSRRSPSFDRWIVRELNAKYQIPKHVAGGFVEEGRLVYLLDGLDEVRPTDQQTCMESLNEFLLRLPPPGLVVCGRYTDYVATDSKLRMDGAVRLKPLTPEQIMASVSESTGARRPLVDALAKHEALLELASCPLMLGMMKASFDNSDAEAMDGFSTIETARQHLFGTFVEEAFRNKQTSTAGFSKPETLSWLSWIAKQMQQRSQTVFLLDELQPDWFVNLAQRLTYLVAFSLSLGAVSGLATMYFWYRMMVIMDTSSSMPYSSLFWLMLQLPVWWAMVCVLDLFVWPNHAARGVLGQAFWGFLKTIIYWALWMVWPIVGHLTGGWATGWTVANVLLGVLTGASVGILGRRKRVTVDVDVAQPLGLSLPGMLRGGLVGYSIGFCVYATYMCLWSLYLFETPPDWFPYFWQDAEERCVSIAWPLGFSSVGLVAGGLMTKMNRERAAPDVGAKIFFRNTLIAFFFCLLIVFPAGLAILAYWLNLEVNPMQLTWSERAKVITGPVLWSAFYMSLCFGALDLLVHALTRMILKVDRLVPDRFPAFLRYVTHLGLLRRVGGAHIFSHRMLLEFFVDRDESHSQRRADS